MAGIWSWRTMSRPGVRAEYLASFAATMETILVLVAVVFAFGTVSAAGFIVAKPALLPSGALFLFAFILLLAILIPIDAGGMCDVRGPALLWSIITPWCFVIAFPCYMFIRPTTSNRSRWVAVLCMIVGLIGFGAWAGSQPRKRVRAPVQSSIAPWAQFAVAVPLPQNQELDSESGALEMPQR